MLLDRLCSMWFWPPPPETAMANKRQHKNSFESVTAAKKIKSDESEFNGTVFRRMLKDSSKVLNGLETFIRIAKKLPSTDIYDVVEGYIKISADCSEIFAVLDEENHSESKMMLIFQSLEMILLRTASDLCHFNMVGSTIVKKTVSTHMKLLLSSLYSDNHWFVRQCLCFLSAMVSQGSEAAKEIFSHMTFSKGLSALAWKKDKTGRPNVRMAYIQFVLSFLMSGDSETIGKILDTKDFLPDILSSGLKEDRISTINLILSTLQTRIVQNKSITKTQKVRFFSASVLAQIASLYKWNGIVDVSTDDENQRDEERGRHIVRELVHNFLLDLCCSRKHGISFHDPSVGTVGRAGNIVLLQFLVGLKHATEDEIVSDLVINVLKSCPDILSRYLKETQFSFTPRIKSTWHDNITLLKKIFKAQPELSEAFQTRDLIPLPRLLSMVLVTSLPSVCNKVFFTQGLNLPNVVVQHTTLSLLTFILKRAQRNIEHCLDGSIWESSDVYSPTMMEDFVQLYRETLSKILPDMVTVISKWQLFSKEKDNTSKTKITEQEGVQKKTFEHDQNNPQLIKVKALLLQVMCLYQKVVPHLVSQCRFDFSKLVKGIVTERGMRKEVPPVLQYQILQLALELPASKFSWFRVQEISDVDLERGEKSVFYLLLKMFVSSSSSYLKTSTRMLILKVLRDSGVFEHTWRELELWLDHLTLLDQSQHDTVIHFLDNVLMRVMRNPHVYTEKVAGAVQEALYLQSNLCGQEDDETSIPISHIDDVLDMVDVIQEGGEGGVGDVGLSLTDDVILQTFPFSVIVPAVLESRNKLPASFSDEKGVLYEYMSVVLCDVLHCQRDPLALCLILQHYDEELNTSVTSQPPHPSITHLHCYYTTWIPKQSQKTLFSADDGSEDPSTGFSALLKACYGARASGFLQDSFNQSLQETLTTLHVSEIPMAVNQMLLYIRTSVITFNEMPKKTAAKVLGRLMSVINLLILKLLNTEPMPQPKPVEQKDGGSLFNDTNLVPAENIDKQQIILSVIKSVFKHPVLEKWFLALELGSFPPHNLNPVRLKELSVCLTESTLVLLDSSTATLRDLNASDIISMYLSATQRAVFQELSEQRNRCLNMESLSIRALLSLHEFMDFASKKEVVSTLLLLPQESLVTPESQLSVYGHAVLKLLTDSMNRLSEYNSCIIALSQAHLQSLAALLISCQCVQLEDFLLQVLTWEPGSAKLLQTDVLLHCIQRDSPSAQAIGNVLMQNCSTHVLSFELWCLEPANLKEITLQSRSFLLLLNAYLQKATWEDPLRPKDIKISVLKALKKALLFKLWSSVQQGEVGVSAELHIEILSNLIRLSATNSDLTKLMNDLPAVLQKPDSNGRWRLVDSITKKLCDHLEDLSHWRECLLTAALQWLTAVYREQKDSQVQQEEAMLTRLTSLLILTKNVAVSEWNNFVKTGLKCRYCDPAFLGALNTLLEIIYRAPDSSKELLPASTLHMMITSHSLFLPTMLLTKDHPDHLQQSKEALISVLLTLLKKCPDLCNSNHFVLLLGAYGATLSTTDQRLLLLLQEYERNDISLTQFQYLLWGPAAVEHHKARRSLGPSLWQKPSSDELLSVLMADRMINTIKHFPQQRYLIPQESKDVMYTQEETKYPDLSSLYDPCFLLPLFSFILRPESVVDCQRFVSCHALGVSVAALSSHDPKMRAAAYQVLGSFYQHLEGARFREKRQLMYLLDTVKNSIQKQNLSVPFMHITYIAKVAQQVLRPEEHMYVMINKFLLGTQFLDLKRVPDFFKLFYSSDLEHRVERDWVLNVLLEGVQDRLCYELCENQGVYQTLLGFGASPLCEPSSQVQIVNVLRQTAYVNRAAYDLIKTHGVLTWILQLIDKRYVDSRLLSCVIELLNALWFTNLGHKENRTDVTSTTQQWSQKCLPMPIINEFLCTLLAIIKHLGGDLTAVRLKLFLHMLYSVLMHCETALSIHRDAGWLILNLQKLSTSEALCLLQRWATLARDTPLLSALQHLANKHKVKELLDSGRERGQGKCQSMKNTPLRVENQADASKEYETNLEEALVEECKPLLRNILMHWEPKQPEPYTTDKPDLSHLDDDAACLILKWSIKTLTESLYNDSSTLALLKWIHRFILPRSAILDSVLHEEGTKKNLLRLYHQTFDCTQQRSTVETLQLISTVMVHLLQGHSSSLSGIHQMVLRTCMPLDADNTAKKETGLKLLSLYIYEVWSGAQTPDLLLTHARLLCRDQRTAIKKPTSHIQHMCQEILSAVKS